ncbi:hypothetical protein, partial [Oleiphilus sp. HI0079]|uniref:hypothetical protein n=2 Tax=Oleiphilus TaxID=141450 RepID=UPI000B12BB6F
MKVFIAGLIVGIGVMYFSAERTLDKLHLFNSEQLHLGLINEYKFFNKTLNEIESGNIEQAIHRIRSIQEANKALIKKCITESC